MERQLVSSPPSERKHLDLLLIRGLRIVAAAGIACSALLAAGAARAQGDLRPSVLEVEWRTARGYERCAAVVVARRPAALEAWTAGHCAAHPFSLVRFFDGFATAGTGVRVLERSTVADAALLSVPVGRVRALRTPLALPARGAPAMGSIVTVIGHPVAALAAPGLGRWTVTAARMGEAAPDPQTGTLEYEVYCPRCGPGDSGSGVFDGTGRFIGIVYGVTEIENADGGRLPDGLYADVIPAGALR